jgi:hypothetical protein
MPDPQKSFKKIKKAGNARNYMQAVNEVLRDAGKSGIKPI